MSDFIPTPTQVLPPAHLAEETPDTTETPDTAETTVAETPIIPEQKVVGLTVSVFDLDLDSADRLAKSLINSFPAGTGYSVHFIREDA